jgi:hypothetical protein
VTRPFLSEDWFGRIDARLPSLSFTPSQLGARLQFEAESPQGRLRWAQVVEHGRLTEWKPGEIADPDLIIRSDLGHAWQMATGRLTAGQALGGVAISYPGSPAVHGAASPMDLGEQPELHELPALPGATMTVLYEYQRGPWGPVHYTISFVGGAVEWMSLDPIEDPDVLVRCSYLQMAQVRRGDVGILDVLANGGTVKGPEGALALLGGISESPEFQRAERACGASGILLAALGELRASASYVDFLREVAQFTDAPCELDSV